jgi:hypothetical protein
MENSDRMLQHANNSEQLFVVRDHDAHCVSIVAHEDWANISDKAERRKIQNRLAQRRYRKKSDEHRGRTWFLIAFLGQRLKKRLRDIERHSVSNPILHDMRAAGFRRLESIAAVNKTEVDGNRLWSTGEKAGDRQNTGDHTQQDAHRMQQDKSSIAQQHSFGSSTYVPCLVQGRGLPNARDSMHDVNRPTQIHCNCDARFRRHQSSTPAGSPITVPDRLFLDMFSETQDRYNKIDRWQTKSPRVSISLRLICDLPAMLGYDKGIRRHKMTFP